MYRILILLFINHIIVQSIKSQDYDLSWPLGFLNNNNQNLVFTPTGIRLDSTLRSSGFRGNSAALSDSIGNLIFYSNGCFIGNSGNDTIPNGGQLSPGNCSNQSCGYLGSIVLHGSFFIPNPGNSDQFYLFNQVCDFATNAYAPTKLYYNLIDRTLNSGVGGLVVKNGIAFNDTLSAELAATKHANGRDWWIIDQKLYRNTFISVLVSDSGVSTPRYQNTGPTLNNVANGWACFSPDGSTFVSTSYNNDLCIYNFDRCTGDIHFREQIVIHDSIGWTFPEFSLSGRFLYLSAGWGLYQYDMQAMDIGQSVILIARPDTFTYLNFQPLFSFPQRGPDGKIYISVGYNLPFLHVINQPDSLGNSCDLQQHSIQTTCGITPLPYFPNYRLGPMNINCDSILQVSSNDPETLSRSLDLYPNPANDYIKVKLDPSKGEISSIQLLSTSGQILSTAINSTELQLTVPPGIYVMIITLDNGVKVYKRLVKE